MGKEKLLSKIFIRFLVTAGLSFAIPYTAFATPKASASEVEKDPTYNTTIVKDYINKCNDTFRELESNGISMKNANDKASVKAYVRSLLPEPEFRTISGNPRQFNYRDESSGVCISAQSK